MCIPSCAAVFANHWAIALQAPLSMGFSMQEYWSGLPFPSSGCLHDPRIKPVSPASPALAGRYFTTAPPGKPGVTWYLEGNRLRDSNPQDILILVGGETG